MSEVDIGIAVSASKQLETELSRSFGAEGKGLHEKISNVSHELPAALIKKLRYIASVRNKAVHEADYHIADIEQFKQDCQLCIATLDELVKRKQAAEQKRADKAARKSARANTADAESNASSHTTPRTSSKAKWFILLVLLAIGVYFYLHAQHIREQQAEVRYQQMLSQAKQRAERLAEQHAREVQQQAYKDIQAATQQLGELAEAQGNSTPAKQPRANASTVSASNSSKAVSHKSVSLVNKQQAYQQKLQAAKADIQQALSQLVSHSQFQFGALQVQPQNRGNTLYVPLSYRIAPQVEPSLKRYFKVLKSKGMLSIAKYSVKDDPFTAELYQWLVHSEISLKLTAGRKQQTLTLAAGRECFVSCSGRGEDKFQLLTALTPSQSTFSYKELNPVPLSSISNAELANLHQLSASLSITQLAGADFAPQTVISMALNGEQLQQNGHSNQQALNAAKAKIDQQLKALIEQSQVMIGEVQVAEQNTHTGNTLHVPVSWQLPQQEIRQLLAQALHLSSNRNTLKIHARNNQTDQQLKPYSAALFDYLLQQQVKIVVHAGKHTGELLIGHSVNCFVSCSVSDNNANAYQLQLTGKPNGNTLQYKQSNPIVLSGISAAELANITDISAQLVVTRRK